MPPRHIRESGPRISVARGTQSTYMHTVVSWLWRATSVADSRIFRWEPLNLVCLTEVDEFESWRSSIYASTVQETDEHQHYSLLVH